MEPKGQPTHSKTQRSRCNRPGFRTALLLIGLLPWLLGGCIEMVTDVEWPEQDPRVVVHSFISPADTAVMALLSWSTPILEETYHYRDDVPVIENARVYIRKRGGTSQALTYDPSRQIYAASTESFPIEASQAYELIVEVPGHPPITGSCRVPGANENLRLLRIDTIPGEWSNRMVVEYAFTDVPGEQVNYYATAVYREVTGQDWETGEPVMRLLRMESMGAGRYFSNKDREGQEFVLRAEAYMHREDPYWDGPVDPPAEPGPLHILLQVTDVHYYRYHRDLENYYPDDFFSEAIHVYSNVEGGMGIFAGLNQQSLIIQP